MHPVTMIKEPEAAALYILSSNDHALQAGESFVVCDAGGGTLDLITYEVLDIKPRLELVELIPGSGKSSPFKLSRHLPLPIPAQEVQCIAVDVL